MGLHKILLYSLMPFSRSVNPCMVEYKMEKEVRDLKKRTTADEPMRSGAEAGERTTRQGPAVDTDPARPVVGAGPVYGTVDDAARRHARDESVHPDWERQPQVNAPQDVGVSTAEGQADAARIRAGRRGSDEMEEPRLERRGDEVSTPLASSARRDTDDRGVVEKMKEKARDVKEDIDRTI